MATHPAVLPLLQVRSAAARHDGRLCGCVLHSVSMCGCVLHHVLACAATISVTVIAKEYTETLAQREGFRVRLTQSYRVELAARCAVMHLFCISRPDFNNRLLLNFYGSLFNCLNRA
jgi:hypothetical protein